jgi:SOS-response transcriptional repressor LexA
VFGKFSVGYFMTANSADAPLVFAGKDMARVSIVGKLVGVIRCREKGS